MSKASARSFVMVTVLAASVVLLAAGCGSSGGHASTPASAAAASTSTAAASSTPKAPISNTVTGTTSDQQGDTADVTVGVGMPQPLAQVSDPVATACNQEVANSGQSVSGAIAIPVQVTARLTSSVKTPLVVNVSNVSYLEPQRHEVEPATDNTSVPIFWGLSYSSGPQCVPNGGGEGLAKVTWNAEQLTPNATTTWEAYLILVRAITPNEPSGEGIADRLLIRPAAIVGNGGVAGDLTPNGLGWVYCSVNESIAGPRSEPYLALSHTTAIHDGCTD